ncbi:sugar phosphotransferase [Nostoc sp. 3335mG]|nr:sugar phosphotransferase [Nostoc sp. 3335mG]
MQAGDAGRFPHGAFLSWQNHWHAWGNAQAYALLRAGKLLGRTDFTASALREVDHFYPYLLKTGMRSAFALRKVGQGYKAYDVERFPQIAYGITPMVLAATEASRQTGQPRYRALAQRLGTWFTGANAARRVMLDPATGRGYDGIVAPGRVNPNAGAESTIEGLFAVTALNGTPLP